MVELCDYSLRKKPHQLHIKFAYFGINNHLQNVSKLKFCVYAIWRFNVLANFLRFIVPHSVRDPNLLFY